jgi:hypothetical protein
LQFDESTSVRQRLLGLRSQSFDERAKNASAHSPDLLAFRDTPSVKAAALRKLKAFQEFARCAGNGGQLVGRDLRLLL